VCPVVAGRSVLDRYALGRSPLDLGPRPATVRAGSRVGYVPAAALVVRRSALDAVGGFDAGLRYGEDVDLIWRLVEAGWSVRYDPAVIARHREPPDWPSWLRRRFHYGSSAGPLARRHGDLLAGPALAGFLAPATLTRRAGGRPLPAGIRRQVALTAPATTALGLLRWGLPIWWPAVVMAARRPTLRRAMAVAVAVPAVVEWWQRRPELDPVRWTVASVADDVTYGAGVWAGCVRSEAVAPLLPRLSGSRRSSSP
jgi:mycofactocin glycosyltransferase